MLTLVWATVLLLQLPGTATATPPAVNGVFCSDNVDQLAVNGTAQQTIKYRLCMDKPALKWKRVDVLPSTSCPPPGTSCTQTTLFPSGTPDGPLFIFTEVAGHPELFNCSTLHPQEPTTSTDLPFSFTAIDAEAALNGTGPVDGHADAQDWRHLRPAAASGPYRKPAEDMHWYLADGDGALAAAVGATQLLKSACVQHYAKVPGDGGSSTTSVGARDYSAGYTRFPPQATFAIPAGCKAAAHHAAEATPEQLAALLPGWQ